MTTINLKSFDIEIGKTFKNFFNQAYRVMDLYIRKGYKLQSLTSNKKQISFKVVNK